MDVGLALLLTCSVVSALLTVLSLFGTYLAVLLVDNQGKNWGWALGLSVGGLVLFTALAVFTGNLYQQGASGVMGAA